MASHTQGPWYWNRFVCASSKEDEPNHYITLGEDNGWRGDEYMSVGGICSEANARLIASAPLLLEALTNAATTLEEIAERTWDKRRHDECRRACDDASEMANAAFEAVRAAIAAATGAQS
jgi:hypothetical protein